MASANASTYQIIITALDRYSGTLASFNTKIAAMSAPLRNLEKSFKNFSEQLGLNEIARQAENVGHKIGHIGAQIGGMLGPLALLGGAASVAGLFEMAKGAAEFGSNLYIASMRTGMAADQLAKLRFAGKAFHLDDEQVDRGLGFFNRVIGDAASGRNKLAAGYFRVMHLGLKDAQGRLISGGNLIGPVMDHFARSTNADERAGASKAFFGRPGMDWIPLLMQGSRKLKELSATFEKMYGKLTPEFFKESYEYEEKWNRMTQAVSGLKVSIGSALMPVLAPLIDKLTSWVMANRRLISDNVKGWVKGIADALQQVNWQRVGNAVASIGNAIAGVMRTLGPFWSTMAVAGVVFAPFIASALELGGAMLGLGGAIGKSVLKFAMLLGAEGLGGMMTKIGALITRFIPGLTGAFAAISGLIEATPLGWILTAIAAVAVGGLLIYKNWKPISAFFQRLWDNTSSGMHAMGLAIGRLGDAFSNLWTALQPLFDALGRIVSKLWDIINSGVLATFGVDLGKLGPIADTLTAPLTLAAKLISGMAWAIDRYARAISAVDAAMSEFQKHHNVSAAVRAGLHPDQDVLSTGHPVTMAEYSRWLKGGMKGSDAQRDSGDGVGVWDLKSWFDFSGKPERMAHALGFFKSKGWSDYVAAAMVGNLAWESGGLNPNAVGDRGTAHGLAQWHAARAAMFAKVMGHPLKGSSGVDQLGFVQYELTHGAYKWVGRMLQHAKTLREATSIMNRLYEAPLSPASSEAQRERNARLALAGGLPRLSASSRRGGTGPRRDEVHAHIKVDVKAPHGTKVRSNVRGTMPTTVDTGRHWGGVSSI